MVKKRCPARTRRANDAHRLHLWPQGAPKTGGKQAQTHLKGGRGGLSWGARARNATKRMRLGGTHEGQWRQRPEDPKLEQPVGTAPFLVFLS